MDNLTRLALVGTANAPTDVATHPAVDNLIAPSLAREARLLAQAGASALYQSAGRLAQTVALPPAAPPETTRELPATLAAWINPQSAPAELEAIAPWMVQRMQQRQAHLPPALLPLVLADARSRALWWPVLGQRGEWLAQLNPDWQTATIPPNLSEAEPRQRLWDEGTLAQRCAALSAQRLADPALARDWLRAALPQEKAEPRLALVQTLTHQLSADDEPLLESLLADRSQAVRQAAAGLLARLPTSACAQRLAARADACLRWTAAAPASGGLLGSVSRLLGGNAPKLTVEPPSAIDKSWERDGIAATPPAASYGGAIREGERAFWLRQVLALVPPARWSQQAQANPAQLLPLLQASEWADALLPGLAQAASHFADSDWASALLDLTYTGKDQHVLSPHTSALWTALDDPTRQAAITVRLQAGHLLNALQGLRTQPAPWPAALTEEVANSASSRQWSLPALLKPSHTTVPERLDERLELLALAALHAADDTLPCLTQALRVCIQATDDALSAVTSANTRSYGDDWHLRQAAKQTDLIQTHLRAKQQFIKELPL